MIRKYLSHHQYKFQNSLWKIKLIFFHSKTINHNIIIMTSIFRKFNILQVLKIPKNLDYLLLHIEPDRVPRIKKMKYPTSTQSDNLNENKVQNREGIWAYFPLWLCQNEYLTWTFNENLANELGYSGRKRLSFLSTEARTICKHNPAEKCNSTIPCPIKRKQRNDLSFYNRS